VKAVLPDHLVKQLIFERPFDIFQQAVLKLFGNFFYLIMHHSKIKSGEK
jgi:hypothetical protein